ncbi:oligosaccharide flippase family protein [Acidobacteria bacterium AH-259-L09]|nr:oligosaccharide flippase family protein [Acidobacteria bacterium AH-259-L09]
MPRYRSKLIKNSLYFGFAQFTQLLCTIILTPFVIHTIGLSKFGIWTVFSAITSIFLLLDLGLASSYLKFISQYYAKKDFDHFNSVINSALIFNMALFGPMLLLAFVFRSHLYSLLNIGPSVYGDIDLIFAGILLIVLITIAASSYTAVLKSIQRLEVFSKISTIAILLKTTLIFFLLRIGLQLEGLLLGELFFVSLVNIASIGYARRLVPSMRISLYLFRFQELKEMINYGVKLQVSQVANLVHQQTDKLLLSNLVNPASVSFYQVAQQIANLLKLVTSFVLPVVLPAASELTAHRDQEGLRQLCTKGLRYVSLIAFSLAGYIWACADQIIIFWLGSTAFDESIEALKWLVVAFAITPLTGFLATVGRGMGVVEFEMRSSLLLVVVQLPLNFFLISIYGVQGAAVGVLLALLVSMSYFVVQFQRKTNILEAPEVSKFLLKLLLGIAPGILLLEFCQYYIPSGLFASRATGATILLSEMLLYYLVLLVSLYSLKCIDRDDLSMFFDLYKFDFHSKQ